LEKGINRWWWWHHNGRLLSIAWKWKNQEKPQVQIQTNVYNLP